MIVRLLKNWRKQIPAMQCAPDCHHCCEGFAPAMMKEEWYRINHPGKMSIGEPINACPFLGAQGCEIYHQRPIICRLFGTVAREEVESADLGLTIFCPKGMEPKEPLPLATALKIETDYIRYQHQELRRTIADFGYWCQVTEMGTELAPKFQWLQYFLSTMSGKQALQMQRQKMELNPQEIKKVERMAALMEGRA